MWNDIHTVLDSPVIETVYRTNTHTDITNIKKYLASLTYTKQHLCHENDEPSQKKAKRTRTEEPTIPISNRFEPLNQDPATDQGNEEENNAEMPDAEDQPVTTAPPKPTRVEPIFISVTGNWAAFVKVLNKEVLATPVKVKLAGEYMKVPCATPDDYRKLTQYLIKINMPFHALQPQTERPAKILIKGLPGHIPQEEIARELIGLNYFPLHVSVLKGRTTKVPLPLFLVTLKKTEGWESIYNIDDLLETTVSIQHFRSSGHKQCYRCQGFGHSSQNCYMPARCVKCGQHHESKACVKPKDVDPTCANCEGDHTANWAGCPLNPKNLPKRKPRNPALRYYQGQRQPQTHYLDAPLPRNPAWLTPNQRIKFPPGAHTDFPPLPTQKEDQPVERKNDVIPPQSSLLSAAQKRAAAATTSREKSARIRQQHEQINQMPSANPKSSTASLSQFGEAMEAIKEFNSIVNLSLFTVTLKKLTMKLKKGAN